MKFVVREDVFGYTEVKLHRDSRNKIFKTLYWMIGGAAIAVFVHDRSKNRNISE